MAASRFVFRFVLFSLVFLTLSSPAQATVLVRRDLGTLTAENDLVLRGRVLDLHSYWNADQSSILTDVRVRPSLLLKGDRGGDMVVTVPGGTVGDVTVLVIGGAELEVGNEYVLFLKDGEIPGAGRRLTIPDHAQGTFRVDGGRVTSMALDEPLLPDEGGSTEPAAGWDGAPLGTFLQEIRAHARRAPEGGSAR